MLQVKFGGDLLVTNYHASKDILRYFYMKFRKLAKQISSFYHTIIPYINETFRKSQRDSQILSPEAATRGFP